MRERKERKEYATSKEAKVLKNNIVQELQRRKQDGKLGVKK
jgi:hypothetical protein